MKPPIWQPPVETSAAEDKIIKHIKRAKLFLFLRRHRHQIFTSEFQVELAGIFKDSPQGQPPVPPAMLALALILQAYTGVSDDEVIEATVMDRRWQLALDCLDAEQAPLNRELRQASRRRSTSISIQQRRIAVSLLHASLTSSKQSQAGVQKGYACRSLTDNPDFLSELLSL
jgi:hypothetical protein